jgi:lipoate-protein ligase A
LPVIRRISGGGTVYHDPGNINFSFIFTKRKENLIDFREFTRPVIGFLEHCGLNASFEGKNNIVVNDVKVSGNAAHLHKNKVLYHGTLLFSSDLDVLNKSISGKDHSFQDMAVRSVRAKVGNICDLLPEKMSAVEFMARFYDFILHKLTDSYPDDLQEVEKEEIQKLSEEKYGQYAWNYGYSPEYRYQEFWQNEEGGFSVFINVKDGLINRIEINGPEVFLPVFQEIIEALSGMRHEKKSISSKLKNLTFVEGKENEIAQEISRHLI